MKAVDIGRGCGWPQPSNERVNQCQRIARIQQNACEYCQEHEEYRDDYRADDRLSISLGFSLDGIACPQSLHCDRREG
jgi:hypothetical protein